jgi:hypothetical protein
VFHIFGAGRGGTSLIAGLLDAHPECEVSFERWSVPFLMNGGEPASRVQAYLVACRSDEIASPKRVWGHKTTTEQIAAAGDTSEFIAATRDIPAIFILRDGRTCIASKVRRTGQPIEQAIERWRFSIHFWEMLRSSGQTLLTIKMEELIISPEATLTRACEFLNLPFHAAMLQGTRSDRMLPEYRRQGFDESAISLPAADPSWLPKIAAELEAAGYMC